MVQDFVNKHFYELFITTWIFGIVLYGVIGLDYVDELCGALLFLMFLFHVFKSSGWYVSKAFVVTLSIFLFYLFYSFYIKSNTTKSILVDFIIQLKPYLAFFCAYQLAPKFSIGQKKLLKSISLLLWSGLLVLGLLKFVDATILHKVMGHPTAFASSVVATSLVYLYASDYTQRDKILFLVMLSVGILSGRSKFYGFMACAFVVVLYFSNPANLKLSAKNLFMFVGMFALILIVAWQKIEFYFVQGITDSADEVDYLARFALYGVSLLLFVDYFPFGSGLGSFATHASQVDYSTIYSTYGIDNVWGLSKTDSSFVADTYYPSLAQFGLVGVLLYGLFWVYVLKKCFGYFQQQNNTRLIILSLLIIGYISIENVADAFFTSNRGFFMMMFLGLITSEQKDEYTTDKKETA